MFKQIKYLNSGSIYHPQKQKSLNKHLYEKGSYSFLRCKRYAMLLECGNVECGVTINADALCKTET